MVREGRPSYAVGFPGGKGTLDMTERCLQYGIAPIYPPADWRLEVENHETRLGYWEWLLGKLGEDYKAVTEPASLLSALPEAKLDKAWMLVIGSESELTDLIDWINDHPSDEEMDEEGIPVTVRARLDTWLRNIADEQEKYAYPCYVPVPLDLVNLLNLLIEDWAEVEESHGETFTTVMVTSEG
jgi:hypothetical protein